MLLFANFSRGIRPPWFGGWVLWLAAVAFACGSDSQAPAVARDQERDDASMLDLASTGQEIGGAIGLGLPDADAGADASVTAEGSGGDDDGDVGGDGDGSAVGNMDAAVDDAAPDDGSDDDQPADAGQDAAVGRDTGDTGASDAGGGDPDGPVLAPRRQACDAAPTGTTCRGGPREVLLVAHRRGRVAALDPEDGTYLGHVAEDTETLALYGAQATQGPDNCIYVVKTDNFNDYAVRRMDTDGTLVDDFVPFVDVDGTVLVDDSPTSLQFHDGTLYISSPNLPNSPNAPPSVGAFDIEGVRIGQPVDDGSNVASLLVLGDGSILTSEDYDDQLRLYPSDGGEPRVITELEQPRQIAYLRNGNVVVAQNVLGEPIVEIDLTTGSIERMIRPITPGTTSVCQTRGVAELGNGRWVMTGGACADSFGIASVDPAEPVGMMDRQGMVQHLPDSIYDDEEPSDGLSDDPNGYTFFGRACLPDGVIVSVP